MGKCLNLCAMALGVMLCFGCAANQSGSASEGAKAEKMRHAYKVALDEKNEHDAVVGHKIVRTAHKAIGTPYVLGGSEPGGFDCSGLVSWTYKSVGVKLPRTAREQSVVGKKIKNIKDMRAGDIVAFRHPKRGYHTGIYVGDGKFIHSPRKRTRVRINSLSDPYFSETLLGARRINVNSGENLLAQAEMALGSLAAPKSLRQKPSSASSAKKSKSIANGKKRNNVKAVASRVEKSKKNIQKLSKRGKNSLVAKAAGKNSKIKTAARNHTPASRLVAHKAQQNKKNNHKAVSMASPKNAKTHAKARNRS